MIGGLSTNYSEGGQYQKGADPSAQYGNSPTGYSTAEGKAAEKVVGLFDKMSFDATRFAHHLVSSGGPGMRRRILDVAIAIVKTYALQWETGVSQDEVARDAMRLKDTLDQFKM